MDNLITVDPPLSSICASNVNTMLIVCEDVGFDINSDKVVKPTQVIESLGIIVESQCMGLSIGNDRLAAALN